MKIFERSALVGALCLALPMTSIGATAPASKAGDGIVPDRYIVVLKTPPGEQNKPQDVRARFAKRSELAKEMAGDQGARVRGVYMYAIDGFTLDMPAKAAARLAADPRVAYVEPVKRFTSDYSPNPYSWSASGGDRWGADLVDNVGGDGLMKTHTDGSGVRIYVMDVGFTHGSNWADEFGTRSSSANVTFQMSFQCPQTTPDPGFCSRMTWRRPCPEGTTSNNGNDHGYYTSGLAASASYGVAKNAEVRSVAVMKMCLVSPTVGTGEIADLVTGIDKVIADVQEPTSPYYGQPAVMSMSLGFAYSANDTALYQAMQNAVAANIVIVVSAGNDASDASTRTPTHYGCPASVNQGIPGVITVASLTSATTAWIGNTTDGGSNYGECVDLYAPGGGVASFLQTKQASVEGPATSWAAPHVAGLAALYLESHPRATPAQVETELLNSAQLLNVDGRWNGSNPERLARWAPSLGQFWGSAPTPVTTSHPSPILGQAFSVSWQPTSGLYQVFVSRDPQPATTGNDAGFQNQRMVCPTATQYQAGTRAIGTTSCSVTLSDLGAHHIRVRSCNSDVTHCSDYAGASEGTRYVSVNVIPVPYGAPQAFTLSGPSSSNTGAVALNWGSAATGSSGTITYSVLRGSSTVATITTQAFTDVLSANGTYQYKVRACNANTPADCIDSNTLTIPVTVPVAPTLSDNDGGYSTDGQFELVWTSMPSGTYTVQRSNNEAFTSPVQIYNGTLTYKNESFAHNGDKFYRVKACTPTTTCPWSEIHQVTVDFGQ